MEATAPQTSNFKNGLTFGLLIGLIYCISLFLRYNFATNPLVLGAIAFVFYLVAIGMLVFCGITRRKQLGGFIDIKDAFQTIFIAVLIAEFIYVAFNVIYLKFIDPHYFDRFITNMQNWIDNSSMSDDQKEKTMDKIKESVDKQMNRGMTVGGIALGYCIWVAITGVFGLIVALIVKKKRPVFEIDQQA
jgi:hypothetical protein